MPSSVMGSISKHNLGKTEYLSNTISHIVSTDFYKILPSQHDTVFFLSALGIVINIDHILRYKISINVKSFKLCKLCSPTRANLN